MKCHSCGAEVNPTLVYCVVCNVPVEISFEDVVNDEQERQDKRKLQVATRSARSLLVLVLFLLGCVIAFRSILLREPFYDYYPAYRVSYQLVANQAKEPREELPVATLEIPLPE